MTTRTDVTYDLRRSPRIAEVAAPSVEMLVQDYVDTTRPFESSFRAMSEVFLISAGGKDDLGGGKLVEITMTEEDLKLSFEARTTAAETGTVTTPSGAPTPNGEISFTDTAADFTTANVARGSLVINFTDQSIADVVSVDASDTLTTKTLVNGIGNTFDAADVYHVFNIIQMTVQGGNVVAVDALDVSSNAILPTAFSQVVLTLSSSGTITSLTDMEAQIAQLHGQVRRSIFIDTSAVSNGDGYQQTPYNNFTDAVDDAEAIGITRLVILADATVDRQLKNFQFYGVGDPTIDVNSQDIDKSEFYDLHLTGAIDPASNIHAHGCEFATGLTGLQGDFFLCGFAGTITLVAGGDSTFIDCYSTIGGLSRPTLDVNGGACNVSVRSYRGGLTVSGADNAGDEITVSMAQGKLTLDASNTDGVISVRGQAQFTDSSAGSTVDTTALLNRLIVENDVWDALISDHAVAGSFGEFIVRRLLTVAKFFSLRT